MAARRNRAREFDFAAFGKSVDALISKHPKKIAVAVSGGADSMALAHLLMRWGYERTIQVHLLTVDHGLRKESKAETKTVAAEIASWPLQPLHQILTWTGRKPKTRLQEEARSARYRLLAQYCGTHKIRHLFLAHHADDQAETVLFRLAKGSGLDGLGGMAATAAYDKQLTLLRPCLNLTHNDLVSYCRSQKIGWVEDPSNGADRFARVRLRQSREILEKEGLSSARLSTTAARLMRARQALEQLTEKEYKKNLCKINTSSIEFILSKVLKLPEEIFVRILSRAIQETGLSRAYPPRLEQIETLAHALRQEGPAFKGATLAGSVIKVKTKLDRLIISSEKSSA